MGVCQIGPTGFNGISVRTYSNALSFPQVSSPDEDAETLDTTTSGSITDRQGPVM